MARFEDGCYGSLKGIALIAKVLAGRCEMHYTRVAAGKGTIPEDLTPKTIVEPPGYVMDAVISSVTNPIDGECQVSVQINSASVEEGFYLTWLLLYAEDPDEGEIPFTALCLENEPEWIRPASSIVGKLATFDMIAAVGDVDKVTATIDPAAIATVAEVQNQINEHNDDPDAHANAFAKHNDDPDAHGGVISNAVEAKMEEMAEAGEVVTPEVVTQVVIREIEKHPSGGYLGKYDLTLPVDGWKQVDDPVSGYEFVCDVKVDGVKSDHVPVGVSDAASDDIAYKSGIRAVCETFDGYIRFFAKRKPDGDIATTVTLFGPGGGGGGVDIGDGLEYDGDGKLKVKAGNGLGFDADKALAVDQKTVMTDEDLVDEDEVQQAVEEIFQDNDAPSGQD